MSSTGMWRSFLWSLPSTSVSVGLTREFLHGKRKALLIPKIPTFQIHDFPWKQRWSPRHSQEPESIKFWVLMRLSQRLLRRDWEYRIPHPYGDGS